MRSTPDNPVDPLGTLGAPVRPAPAPAPDPTKTFAAGNWAPKGLVITDKPAPISSHSADELKGIAEALHP